MALSKRNQRDPRNRFSVWATNIGRASIWGAITALLSALALFAAIPVLASGSVPSDAEVGKVLLAVLGLTAFAVTNIWFLVALINFGYRAVGFVRERGVKTKFGPGWAIGGWFIPVASIFLPYLVLRDVAGVGTPESDQRKRSLLAFWLAWQIVNNVASYGLQEATGKDSSLFYQGYVITACSIAFFAVPMMMGRKLFREINADLSAFIV